MQNVNSGTTTYNAVAYVRVSKEDIAAGQVKKAESNSISNQKKLISDFVKDKQEMDILGQIMTVLPFSLCWMILGQGVLIV